MILPPDGAIIRAPRRERKFPRDQLHAAADGSVLAVNRDITELKEREEALAAAKDRRRSRARRRRAHAADHADRARQHDRRRHVVRQGFPPAVPQPAGDGIPELSGRHHQAGHLRLGHPALSGGARRLWPGEGRRSEGARARRADPQAGRQPLPAPHAGRPLRRVQFPAARRWRPAGVRPRRDLAEGARGSARLRQGSRRARARRRRAHARGDADRARQHERRRHAVGQELPLDVLQPLQQASCGAYKPAS